MIIARRERERRKSTSRRLPSAQFNYLPRGIPASTAPHGEPTPAAHPLTYTHSIRQPNRAGVRKTRPATETMPPMQVFRERQESLEGTESSFCISGDTRGGLRGVEVGGGEDAGTEWLFLKDPLLPDEPKSFSPFCAKWPLCKRRITNTREWVVIFQVPFSNLQVAPRNPVLPRVGRGGGQSGGEIKKRKPQESFLEANKVWKVQDKRDFCKCFQLSLCVCVFCINRWDFFGFQGWTSWCFAGCKVSCGRALSCSSQLVLACISLQERP